MKRIFDKPVRNILIIASLPVQLILVRILSADPAWVEQFYTSFFYKKLSYFLRILFGSFNFAVGQLLFYSLITGLLLAIIKHIKRLLLKKISLPQFARDSLWGVGIFLAIFYFLFTALWALNYYRKPVESITNIKPAEVTPAELEIICTRLIELTNRSRNQISKNINQPLQVPITRAEMLSKATEGFKRASKYHPEFTYKYASVKPVFVPQLMSFFGVSGIYFPLTGEANINMHPPAYLLPGTICHEMAHQIGFASEDEANYVSYVVCRLNPDLTFQYSGNYMALKYAMNRLKKVSPGRYKKLEKRYSAGLRQDLAYNRAYWEKFQNPIEEFSDWFYDLFLKANDQEDGVESYSKVVELLMGEYRKNKLNY